LAIWEPKSKAVLQEAFSQGFHSPRKALLQGNTKIIKPPEPSALLNVNTPEEMEKAKTGTIKVTVKAKTVTENSNGNSKGSKDDRDRDLRFSLILIMQLRPTINK